MDSDLKQAFQKALYHPEDRLSLDIWHNIEAKENKIHKIKTWIYSSLGIISFILLILSVKDLFTQFSLRGFSQYISLVFSDFGVVTTYWKEFTLSLVNSLPLASIALSFFLVFVLFTSVGQIARQFKSKLLLAS